MGKYRLINNVLGWVVFAIASAVYLMTIEPTASFWDCGEFISSAYKLEVGHPPGAPFFMLTANLFTQLASDPSQVARMVNSMSALFSGLTILFLFWSITHMVRKVIVKQVDPSTGEMSVTPGELVTIMGCGLVGALVYTFSDTFWFSAVEGEVYAYSSLFTALVFWLILKWEDVADRPHADRWLVLIAYLMGLSIGVHLLNLLCIPAIVLVYYYKKFPNPTMKGTLLALLVSCVIVGLMMYGVIQGLVEVCGWFELLFVNVFGLPYNSGVFAYVILLLGVLAWAIYETMRDQVHPVRMKIAFILAVVLLGVPFIGSGYVFGILFIVALTAALFYFKRVNIRMLNTILISLLVIVIGYSSYALILVRSTAETPMDQNSPKDIFTLRTYLAREQYGKVPLIYGPTYVSEVKREGSGCTAVIKEGAPVWTRVIKKSPDEKDRYYVSDHDREGVYVEELNMLFPRMYSADPNHIEAYKEWANIKGTPVTFDRCGESVTVMKPTFFDNLKFFFSYQLNFMYWRYFMWNFSGRQNDIQGHGEVNHGNWITGIKFIDTALTGPQDDMPYDIVQNKGHNVYYMLPLLLGILGLLFQAYSGQKGIQAFWVTFFLFFMTGIAIVLYLNQPPYQPRERDYAYAGSFYAFCIWIGFGVAAIARLLQRYGRMPGVWGAAVASVACLFVPIQMAGQNWDDHDRSNRYVCRDFGANYLESCEPNAIIFTNGDNDTFPLWYNQEVEGKRTDVRVCNTSYLQTSWYIDQMKRQAYDSDPLPISWNPEDYVQGTRDMAYILPLTDKTVDLGTALNFVRSNDERYKRIPGTNQKVDYIPSNKLSYKVDTLAALAAGVAPADSVLLREMNIDLTGKDILAKQELIILDMLQTNNWERPIYFATTVSPEQYVRLDSFFRQTGMAYQLVPMQTKDTDLAVDTDKMFDNVMNKFKWGGVDNPKVYVDENTMRMAKGFRYGLFSPLVSALLNEGKNEKALQALDYAMKVLPPETIPLDFSAMSFGEYYYALDQKEKARELLSAIADNSLRNLNWYFRLNPNQFASVMSDVRRDVATLQNVVFIAQQYDPELAQKYKQEYDTFRMAFTSLFGNKQRKD